MSLNFPWHSIPGWSIAGMHHYTVDGERHLFVSMQRGNHCITEQGKDDQYLWNRLWHKAQELSNPTPKPKLMFHVYPDVKLIQTVVAYHFGVRLIDLVGPAKTRSFIRPRMIAMHLARSLTSWSLAEIGDQFGGRDHTTVAHNCTRIDRSMVDDRNLVHTIDQLRNDLKGKLQALRK